MSSISEAQAVLISSLSPDDIPIKLRCAICSKLAVNAFRLPCCEQAICETCQSSLPQSCPVCEHSPLAADDCSPNKSLRTTIRVFLRTAEKKREANRPKESKDSTPVAPVEAPKPSQAAAESVTDDSAARQAVNGPAQADEAAVAAARPRNDAVQSVTQDDEKAPTTQPGGRSLSGPAGEKDDGAGHTEHGEHGGLPGSTAEEGVSQQMADGTQGPEKAVADEDEGPGDEENEQNNMAMNGGYANMMFSGSGDFGQMQMMMAMQNGMGSSPFGGFPIMGIDMDPMTMQNMYMNGGFQGMGMNGMNHMNGLGGYGVGFGQGSDNNWNGSQAWNIDQNNYNQSGLGMAAGDFGNLNAGFQTGYNQGSYGHFNDYRHNNFGRGRGRGRGYHGGFGRGGYHQHGGGNQDQGFYSQHGYTQAQGQVEAGARGEAGAGDGKQTDELGFPGRAGDEGDQGQGQRPGDGGDTDAEGTQQDEAGQLACREAAGGHDASGNESRAAGGASKDPGAIRSVLSAPDAPINAPTGPRAMRQGLPNTSLHHLRARGYQVDAVPSEASPAGAPGQQAAAPDDGGSGGRSRSPDGDGPARERSRGRQSAGHGAQDQPGRAPSRPGSRRDNRSPSPARSRSRSRSRGHRGSHRHRRPRSPSGDDDNGDGEQDDGHHRKRHRGGRKRQDVDEYDHYRPREDKRSAEKSRSVSPGESRKSGHRGHKDREPDGRRERERHWDDDGQRSGQRSHRDRDRDRNRVRDRDRGWDRARERDRERDHEHSRRRNRDRRQRKERQRERREREQRHGSGSRADDPPAVDKGFDPPRGPRGPEARASGPGASRGGGGAAKDPHTLEREARNRERLLKEAQRMAGLAGARAKRGRDDGDDGGRAKGRRSGRRSEARDGEEREGGRWA